MKEIFLFLTFVVLVIMAGSVDTLAAIATDRAKLSTMPSTVEIFKVGVIGAVGKGTPEKEQITAPKEETGDTQIEKISFHEHDYHHGRTELM